MRECCIVQHPKTGKWWANPSEVDIKWDKNGESILGPFDTKDEAWQEVVNWVDDFYNETYDAYADYELMVRDAVRVLLKTINKPREI